MLISVFEGKIRVSNDMFERFVHRKAFIFADEPKIVYSLKFNLQSDIEAKVNCHILNISNFAKIWYFEPFLNRCFYLQNDLNLSLNVFGG